MRKTYQRTVSEASEAPVHAVPEQVSVAMTEIAGDVREGLLALAVGAGLQVMAAMFEADVTAVAGPRAATTRSGSRSGTAPGVAR